MPTATFLVKASRGDRFVTELSVEAASTRAARARVAAEGFAVIGVTEPQARRRGGALAGAAV